MRGSGWSALSSLCKTFLGLPTWAQPFLRFSAPEGPRCQRGFPQTKSQSIMEAISGVFSMAMHSAARLTQECTAGKPLLVNEIFLGRIMPLLYESSCHYHAGAILEPCDGHMPSHCASATS